jgi:phenylalanyl-tRNA synthetase beta chain
VVLRVERASKVIGMPVTEQQCLQALQGLGLPATASKGVITVVPPSYRFDLQIEEDLIEEVIRVIGYHKLPTTPPQAPITPKLRAETQRNPYAVRRQLAAWATRKPSTTALWKSAGSMNWPATPAPSSCSTPSPAR